MLGSLVELMSWHLCDRGPVQRTMNQYPTNQRQALMINSDISNLKTSAIRKWHPGNKVREHCKQNHETLDQWVEDHARKDFNIFEFLPGFRVISNLLMDGSRTFLNGEKFASRLHLENLLLNLLLLFFINVLLKRNIISLELHVITTAILHWENAQATLSPTSSYTLSSSAHIMKSSPQADNSPSRTSNASNEKSDGTSQLTPITSAVTKSTKLAHLQGICDEDWIHEGDLCYGIVEEPRQFNHAERFCEMKSAHLLSIANKEENDMIFDLVKEILGPPGKIWLGMERLSSDSKLHWIDKTPITYDNWAPGEPDNNGACVQMIHKGWWEDVSCVQRLPSICKKGSKESLPYSRATELGILIGIPLTCSAIMLSVVGVLLVRSIYDSEGTYYGYGKNRNKDKLHSCLVTMTTSIAHVSTMGYNDERRFSEASIRSNRSAQSSHSDADNHSSDHSRGNSIVEAPEIKITPETPEVERRFEARVFASSSTSIDQERFQSTTSLENLLSKKYIKPKTRRLRSLRKSEAVVSPAGHDGKYTKKNDQFEFYEI